MHPHQLQKNISQTPVYHRTDPQCHDIHTGTVSQIIKLEHLHPVGNRALSVGKSLARSACKGYASEGVWCQISDGVAHRREVVYCLEERRHVDREDARHKLGDGKEDRCKINCETCMIKECVELQLSVSRLGCYCRS